MRGTRTGTTIALQPACRGGVRNGGRTNDRQHIRWLSVSKNPVSKQGVPSATTTNQIACLIEKMKSTLYRLT